jgi:MFS family permease
MNSKKLMFILVLGNILEYYDFLLFAHLGFIVTPLFFPEHSSTHTHILSLVLFGASFLIRPIGGYIFGQMADLLGRKKALVDSMKWASIPALGIALLPTYESIGVVGCYLFVIFRLLQGVALGGEYPVAGTYLMEKNKNNQGLLSGILVASGSVGSIIGLGFASLCLMDGSPQWLWRVAFLLGSLGGIISYKMRQILSETLIVPINITPNNHDQAMVYKRFIIVLLGILVSTSVWIPMTYSNFYITKILNQPSNYGLYASFVALVFYIFILPFMGMIYDYYKNPRMFMTIAAFMVGPLSMIGFYFLTHGDIVVPQMILVTSAAFFGAAIHTFMNSFFPIETRGRNIGFLLMAGLSFGGIFPSICGYIVDTTRWDMAPAFLIACISLIIGICFYRLPNENI